MKASRPFPAKYTSTCACGGTITKGTRVRMAAGRAWHDGCAPTGVDPAADREYLRGAQEATRYMEDRRMFGEALADQWDMEREMRDGDGW